MVNKFYSLLAMLILPAALTGPAIAQHLEAVEEIVSRHTNRLLEELGKSR